ncbi:MAG TPA: tail fiber protein [Anaerolineae bacterium]|nr:tail fiber protein [Anaerolineae bacterium]
MGTPYIGEIRMFGGNFAPAGWAFCDGQLMPIAENDALFTLIGTTYGGDGQTTFALPDLRGRIPIHQGTGGGLTPRTLGESGGVETVTLTVNQSPAHAHTFVGTASTASAANPANALVAAPSTIDLYRPATAPNSNLAANALGATGGSQPHDNLQPYQCISFIISLFGIFPTQN